MAIRDIVQDGNPVLRKEARVVEEFDDRLARLLDDMKETMYKKEGVGLAAPQVGISRRAVVIGYEDFFIEMINPIIIKQEGGQISPEGCLSCPGIYYFVERPQKVEISYYDRHGNAKKIVAVDFIAKACCHEIDHLDGILFYDKKCDPPKEEKKSKKDKTN